MATTRNSLADIFSLVSPALQTQIDPLRFDSPEDEELSFAEGFAQGIGNIGTLVADAPFTLKQLADEATEDIASRITAPALRAFGRDVSAEEIRENLREERRRRNLEGLGRFISSERGDFNVKERLGKALQEQTGFRGFEDVVSDGDVNIPGALGLGIGTLGGGAALSALPVIGAASQARLEGSILNQLARLGITEGSKRAIAAQVGTTGLANAALGSPLTVSAARRPDGSLDPKELALGVAIDFGAGAGLAGAGIAALKGGAAGLQAIDGIIGNLRKRGNEVSKRFFQKKQINDQLKIEEAQQRALETELEEVPVQTDIPQTVDDVVETQVIDEITADPQALQVESNPEQLKIFADTVDSEVEGIGNSASQLFEDLPGLGARKPVKGPLPSAENVKGDQWFDKFIQPISTRVEKINPQLGADLRRFEFKAMLRPYEYKRRVTPFLRTLKNVVSPEDQRQLKQLLFNRQNDQAKEILTRYQDAPGGETILADFQEVSNVLGDIYNKATQAGMDVGHLENYYPRQVKDFEKFLKATGSDNISPVRKAWREKAAQLGKRVNELTREEKADVVNKVLMNQRRGPGGPGFTKNRKIEQINDADLLSLPGQKEQFTLLDLYSEPEESLLKYIDRMSYEIEKRNFLGKGENVNESLGARVADLVEEGRIRPEDEQKLQNILEARFIKANEAPAEATNIFRDLIYGATIGNPFSTVTQLGDLGLSMFNNGVLDTVLALKSPKKIKMQDLGLEDIAAELSDPRSTAKYLDKILTTTGFKRIDRLGKETNLNASFRKMQRLAQRGKGKQFDKFIQEQKLVFEEGAELDNFLKALREGDTQNENVRLAVFNDLSEVQPISLSELPEQYLRMPNGRIIYMLKSFTLKQIDLLRKKIFSQMAKNPTKGMKDLIRFGATFGITTLGTNQIKDFMGGRQTSLPDALMDTMLQTLGLSKYNIYRFRTEGPTRAAIDLITPPIQPLVDDPLMDIKDIVEGKIESPLELRSVKNVPIVGKPIFWRLGGGRQKEERRRKQKEKEERKGRRRGRSRLRRRARRRTRRRNR